MRLILISILVMLTFITACEPEQANIPQPTQPTYTADQVIYVARANSPDCIRPDIIVPLWSAIYQPYNGYWLVTKRCCRRGWDDTAYSTETWHFYEANGKLVKIE